MFFLICDLFFFEGVRKLCFTFLNILDSCPSVGFKRLRRGKGGEDLLAFDIDVALLTDSLVSPSGWNARAGLLSSALGLWIVRVYFENVL